ncbi:MAG: hypothetical protein KJ709_04730 [Nanoarchaeota archaeon]|nr:hypothetical protein [Nanoarchaeota archaeon]
MDQAEEEEFDRIMELHGKYVELDRDKYIAKINISTCREVFEHLYTSIPPAAFDVDEGSMDDQCFIVYLEKRPKFTEWIQEHAGLKIFYWSLDHLK